MTIFFISDTHFGHKNILNFEMSFRPFSCIEEHNEKLIENWNKKVKKNDLVWHLGDFCFGSKNIEIAERLNGRKKLVLGNHDTYPSFKYLKYFEKLYGCVSIERYLLTHVPVGIEQLDRFNRNIHGHTHHVSLKDKRYVNVSVESINLEPIALEEIGV